MSTNEHSDNLSPTTSNPLKENQTLDTVLDQPHSGSNSQKSGVQPEKSIQENQGEDQSGNLQNNSSQEGETNLLHLNKQDNRQSPSKERIEDGGGTGPSNQSNNNGVTNTFGQSLPVASGQVSKNKEGLPQQVIGPESSNQAARSQRATDQFAQSIEENLFPQKRKRTDSKADPVKKKFQTEMHDFFKKQNAGILQEDQDIEMNDDDSEFLSQRDEDLAGTGLINLDGFEQVSFLKNEEEPYKNSKRNKVKPTNSLTGFGNSKRIRFDDQFGLQEPHARQTSNGFGIDSLEDLQHETNDHPPQNGFNEDSSGAASSTPISGTRRQPNNSTNHGTGITTHSLENFQQRTSERRSFANRINQFPQGVTMLQDDGWTVDFSDSKLLTLLFESIYTRLDADTGKQFLSVVFRNKELLEQLEAILASGKDIQLQPHESLMFAASSSQEPLLSDIDLAGRTLNLPMLIQTDSAFLSQPSEVQALLRKVYFSEKFFHDAHHKLVSVSNEVYCDRELSLPFKEGKLNFDGLAFNLVELLSPIGSSNSVLQEKLVGGHNYCDFLLCKWLHYTKSKNRNFNSTGKTVSMMREIMNDLLTSFKDLYEMDASKKCWVNKKVRVQPILYVSCVIKYLTAWIEGFQQRTDSEFGAFYDHLCRAKTNLLNARLQPTTLLHQLENVDLKELIGPILYYVQTCHSSLAHFFQGNTIVPLLDRFVPLTGEAYQFCLAQSIAKMQNKVSNFNHLHFDSAAEHVRATSRTLYAVVLLTEGHVNIELVWEPCFFEGQANLLLEDLQQLRMHVVPSVVEHSINGLQILQQQSLVSEHCRIGSILLIDSQRNRMNPANVEGMELMDFFVKCDVNNRFFSKEFRLQDSSRLPQAFDLSLYSLVAVSSKPSMPFKCVLVVETTLSQTVSNELLQPTNEDHARKFGFMRVAIQKRLDLNHENEKVPLQDYLSKQTALYPARIAEMLVFVQKFERIVAKTCNFNPFKQEFVQLADEMDKRLALVQSQLVKDEPMQIILFSTAFRSFQAHCRKKLETSAGGSNQNKLAYVTDILTLLAQLKAIEQLCQIEMDEVIGSKAIFYLLIVRLCQELRDCSNEESQVVVEIPPEVVELFDSVENKETTSEIQQASDQGSTVKEISVSVIGHLTNFDRHVIDNLQKHRVSALDLEIKMPKFFDAETDFSVHPENAKSRKNYRYTNWITEITSARALVLLFQESNFQNELCLYKYFMLRQLRRHSFVKQEYFDEFLMSRPSRFLQNVQHSPKFGLEDEKEFVRTLSILIVDLITDLDLNLSTTRLSNPRWTQEKISDAQNPCFLTLDEQAVIKQVFKQSSQEVQSIQQPIKVSSLRIFAQMQAFRKLPIKKHSSILKYCALQFILKRLGDVLQDILANKLDHTRLCLTDAVLENLPKDVLHLHSAFLKHAEEHFQSAHNAPLMFFDVNFLESHMRFMIQGVKNSLDDLGNHFVSIDQILFLISNFITSASVVELDKNKKQYLNGLAKVLTEYHKGEEHLKSTETNLSASEFKYHLAKGTLPLSYLECSPVLHASKDEAKSIVKIEFLSRIHLDFLPLIQFAGKPEQVTRLDQLTDSLSALIQSENLNQTNDANNDNSIEKQGNGKFLLELIFVDCIETTARSAAQTSHLAQTPSVKVLKCLFQKGADEKLEILVVNDSNGAQLQELTSVLKDLFDKPTKSTFPFFVTASVYTSRLVKSDHADFVQLARLLGNGEFVESILFNDYQLSQPLVKSHTYPKGVWSPNSLVLEVLKVHIEKHTSANPALLRNYCELLRASSLLRKVTHRNIPLQTLVKQVLRAL